MFGIFDCTKNNRPYWQAQEKYRAEENKRS